MTAPQTKKPVSEEIIKSKTSKVDPFRLEKIYKNASSIFDANIAPNAADENVMVVLDTNVLLLPYTICKDSLIDINTLYEKINSFKRLFIPSRVAREFITNRDKKLADLVKVLGEVKSQINIGKTDLSPILEGIDGSAAMRDASRALLEAKKTYTSALESVESEVLSWSGNDPLTVAYRSLFNEDNIISPSEDESDLSREWAYRLENKVPPGYKDSAKDDTGVGDFLIWKAILHLGESQQKDLVFVTGEEKADWFVRSNNKGAYPRPELVAEYKIYSGGRNIKFVELHELLKEFNLPQDVINEVEGAEIKARNEMSVKNTFNDSPIVPKITYSLSALGRPKVAKFVIGYGGEEVTFNADRAKFIFQVSEAATDTIWIYQNSTDSLRLIPEGYEGNLDALHLSSANRCYMLSAGQAVYAKNNDGFKMIARLIDANLPNQHQAFELSFSYVILAPGSGWIMP